MQLIRSLKAWSVESVRKRLIEDRLVGVTLGNFDGMHLGHQALFQRLQTELEGLTRKEKVKGASILCTFHPHPATMIAPERATPELMTVRDKFEFAKSFGFDGMFVIPFSEEFSRLSAEVFVEQYLVSALRCRVVVVGHDWKFGCGRRGNADLMRELGKKHRYTVSVVPPVEVAGKRVSSSGLKSALREGNLAQVKQLLGREYSFSGKVIVGEQRGRTLGFPTANVDPGEYFLPRNGVYATRAVVAGALVSSVTNIGLRPTFNGTKRLVEVHLLGRTDWELYQKHIGIRFVEYLRDEKKFGSVAELQAAITADAERARGALG